MGYYSKRILLERKWWYRLWMFAERPVSLTLIVIGAIGWLAFRGAVMAVVFLGVVWAWIELFR